MALDPLRFAIEIVDEASSKLTGIKTLIDGLNNKEITVNVQGNLREVLDILSKSGTDANALSGLQNALSGALSALEGLGNAARNGDLGTFSTEVGTATAAVNGLATAFEKMNVAVGSNESFRAFMAGVGELVSRTNSAMKQLNSVGGNEGGNDSADKGFLRLSTSIEKAKYELYQFDNLIKSAESASRLGKQFGDVDTNGLDKAIEKAKKFRAELEQISQTGKGRDDRRFDKFALDAEYKKAVDQVRQLSAEQHTSEMNLARYNAMLKETDALWDRVIASWVKGSNLGVATDKMQPAERQAHDFYQRLKSLNEADISNVQIISQLAAEFQRLKGVLTATAKEQEKLNSATEKANKKAQDAAAKRQADAAKQAQKENEKWAQSMTQASNEANKLGIKIRDLQRIEEKGSALGVDTSKLKDYIHQLEIYKSLLESISNGYRGIGHTSEWIKGTQKIQGFDSLGNTMRLAGEAAANVNRLSGEQEKAARTTSQLTAEEQRLAQALNQTTEHARGQSQVLSDLKSMAMQYLGVWGGQQFLRNIIEIGGQLEMQRLSIGAILQNQSQANDLFERIKGLAVQSPFGVVELDQMTKQLTAYGFKYNELFDMTKRLADISAATGTGVDRLVLALGHVRSEAALSGYTLRQFSMANVPLLQKLSEKLGKTTQEIRKMVRAKEVSYEDVIGVLKDITNEGGMFYNMQEVISQSVKAKFKNVKDAMDIMYGEMAEGYIGDSLKGVADALMEVTRNWKDTATVLGTGSALWAAQRVAVMAYTSTIGQNNAAVLSNIAAHRQKEAAMLRDASTYRALSVAELQQLATLKNLTIWERIRVKLGGQLSLARQRSLALARDQQVRNLTLALSEKKLTTEAILRQVAYGRLLKWQAREIISNAELAASDRAAALAALDHTTKLKGLALASEMVGNSIRKAALAIKGFALNPAMLGMAAVTALIELWQSHNSQMEKAEEIGQNIYQHSQDAIKASQTMLKEYSASLILTNGQGMQLKDAQFSDLGIKNIKNARIKLPEFDTEIAEQAIEQWSTYIRDYAYNSAQILNNALYDNEGNVRSLANQFNNLRDAVSNVVLAQYGLQDLSGSFENAVKATNSDWEIDDDVITNIKEYTTTMRKANAEISKLYSGKFREGIDKGIAFAQQHSKAFAEATKDVQTYGEAFDVLIKRYDEFPDAARMVNDSSRLDIGGNMNVMDRVKELRRDKEAMDNDLQTFYITLKADLERQGLDLQNLSENQQQALLLGYKKQLEEAGNLSEGLMKELMLAFAQEFHIPLVIDDEKFMPKLDETKRLLKELTGEDWEVDLRFATNITNVIDEARKQYKAAKEFYANAEPVMLKFGIKFKLGDALSEDQIKALVAKAPAESKEFLEQLLKGANEASKLFNQATSASEAGGFSLEDPNKKSKSKNKSKSGSKKAYKDEVAAEWRERIKLLKDANSLYKEWNKRSGEDAALSRVRQQYGDIFEKWRTDKNLPWKDFKAEDIIEYRSYIQKIVDEAQKRYNAQRNDKAKNYGKEAEAVLREGKKLLDDIDKYDFDEKAREFKTSFEKALDDITRRWEIFNSVREATGDKMLAFDMAGISQGSRDLRNAADALKRNLADEMQRVGGGELIAKIPFSIDIDEEKLRDQFKAALGDSEKYATTIDGLVEAYKKWQKLQQDVVKSDIDVFSKLIGSVVSYSAQIRKINDELAKQKISIAESGASQSQQQQAVQLAESQADWKKMKLSADYSNLYNKTIAMSRTEFENAADAVQRMIDKLRDLGAMSPDEYLQEVDKLNKARMEWSTGGFLGERGAFGNFISGGNQGLMGYYQQRADAARRRADYLKDIELVPGAAQKSARAEAEHYQKLYEALKKLTDEAQKVVTAFQTLQSGIDLLGGLFDSLGMEGAANAMSDAGGILGGALQGASSLSALGPYGMAAGAAIGLIGGIAQVHDKSLERHINKLREDVKGIEANTELIAQARERTLGYDTGDLRRSYADMYGNSTRDALQKLLKDGFSFGGGFKQNRRNYEANAAMYEYYSQNSQGTGYQQEYDNLVEQREKYMEILKDQQDKKKKSNEEIEETKSKIAELDDQIAYFSQDLAKELWGIDIKGWADQLSDALASAFENGENMAKAYRDTVTSIIQQMMQKMMQMAILEPMFERLQKQLFGENGKGGVFDPNNPKGSMSKVTKIIGDYFGKGGEGEKAITASMEFMTAFQRGMQNAGLTVLNEASNTLSSGIQGTSEETSDLLAGYVNALRQDVSANRILLTQYITQLWPQYIEAYTAQVTSVSSIDNNVRVIMEMMQLGNGAMYDQIAAMRTRIDNIVMGIDRVSIR